MVVHQEPIYLSLARGGPKLEANVRRLNPSATGPHMACILLWSSAVRVHDSQAYRKMDVTRERISRIKVRLRLRYNQCRLLFPTDGTAKTAHAVARASVQLVGKIIMRIQRIGLDEYFCTVFLAAGRLSYKFVSMISKQK